MADVFWHVSAIRSRGDFSPCTGCLTPPVEKAGTKPDAIKGSISSPLVFNCLLLQILALPPFLSEIP